MATVARSRLREMLARAIGFYWSSTTTSAGATSGLTLIDTEAARYPSSQYVGEWALVTGGTATTIVGQSRRISTGGATVTVVSAYGAPTTVPASATYEVLPIDPVILHDALQQASRTLAPFLYLPLRDESLIVDNLLANPGFETSTAGPVFTSWSSIGTPTLTAETTRKIHGAQAAGIAATGATEGLEQNLYTSVNIRDIAGKTLQVRGWVWASAASAVRLRVTFDGSTYSNGPWHGGDQEWEGPDIQTISVTVPSTATEMTVSCEVTDGNTGYFDLVAAWVDRVNRYTIPTAFYPNGPHQVYQQEDQGRPDGLYLPLGVYNPPLSGRVLRLVGQGRLTVPTTDSGTVEIDESQAELLVAQAAAYVFRTLRGSDYGNRDRHVQDEGFWQAAADRLRVQPSMRMTQMPAHRRDIWGVTEDANGRYLILKDR